MIRCAAAAALVGAMTAGVAASPLGATEDSPAETALAKVNVVRYGGADRFETSVLTSVALADYLAGEPQYRGTRSVIVASGQVFADALVAGQLSGRFHLPILLNPPHALHSKVREHLTSNDVKQVILMGGTAALSEDVEESIEKLGIRVLRFAGETRFETAVEVARITGLGSCHLGGRSLAVGLTRAWVPYDAFSATPMLARYGAPLLLTAPDELPAATMAYLDEARATQAGCNNDPLMLIVIGGDAAVSQEAIDAYLQRGEEVVTTDD